MRRNLVKLAAVLWILALSVFAGGFHLGFLAIGWFVAGLVVLGAGTVLAPQRPAATGAAGLLVVACILTTTFGGLFLLPSALLLLAAAGMRSRAASPGPAITA